MIVREVPIRNASSRKLGICVEPWGEWHELQSGESLKLVFYGPSGGAPETVIDELDIAVYGWEKSQVFVLKDDICVSQPSLLEIIRRLFVSNHIDPTRFKLDPELIDYAQSELDAAPAWDENGQLAAFTAVSRLAPLFGKLLCESVVWEFCQRVLHSRGVFLRNDKRWFRKFFQAIEKRRSDPFDVLAKWFEASAKSTEAAESVIGD
jgi:hypothetical protein